MPAFVPFHDWLTKQKSQRTPVGDLARELLKDEGFPHDVTTLDALLTYIRTSPGASSASSGPATLSQTLAKARLTWRAFERGR